ncbi:uncharacterized protein SAPINGB_P003430 [Magnusiomyces paraingens]|uniref:Actin-related protein 4 n=1 Tax=Magnusiomyces paraingens TaxID=2606893 RepID=A0A5E8BPB7_9ASCO|nr:uncharacterized protein SAPINGB_P003430 [Saprochaete ingens]VVT53153.1 unnamed protein product [Saprochaete ingens]
MTTDPTIIPVSNSAYKVPHSDEIPAIVIENGSSFTRVGYAGEGLPRHVFITRYGKDAEGKFYFGDRAVHRFDSGKEIYAPMADGIVQDWDAMARNWRYCYHELLGVEEDATNELPLATTEPTWNPASNKSKAAEIAFEDLGVPLFTIVKNPLCTAYNSELPTALIVDIGSSVATVTPILDGNIISNGCLHSRFAGDFVTLHIVNMLKSKNINIVPPYRIKKRVQLDLNQAPDESCYRSDIVDKDVTESYNYFEVDRLLDEFKETTSFVSDTPLQIGTYQSKVARPFELPDGFNTLLTAERLSTVEPLFRPSAYPLQGISIPEGSLGISELIQQSLAKSEITLETVSVLLNNVIVAGGTTLLQGLATRISNDLAVVYPNMKMRVLQQNNQLAQKSTVWTGASILASLGHYDTTWVTKQEYDELGADLVEKRFK